MTIERVAAGHDSPGALRVTGRQPSGWNFAWSPRFALTEGAAYRAVLWVRRNAAPAGSRPLYFKVELSNRDPEKNTRVGSNRLPVDAEGTWQHLTVEFRVPDGCERAAVALEKGTDEPAAVDVTIDDFRLVRIEKLTAEARFENARLTGPIAGPLKGVHPRLYLDAAKLKRLRAETKTNPAWAPAIETLIAIADRGVRRGPPQYAERLKNDDRKRGSREQLWQRGVGNMIPHIAMAFLLTGKEHYLAAAKRWVFASLDYPTWGLGRTDTMDLAAGHQFAGIGLAYDWLYHDLAPAERRTVRDKLVARGDRMARGAAAGRAWWHDAYMQNHQWVSLGGLATAAFAVCDEAPTANAWVHLAHEKFLTTLRTVGDDGASHEGYGYWEYGAAYIMRYLELARDLLGIDCYHAGGAAHPWLSKNPLYALHLAMPPDGWERRECTIDLGDCPRYHWYGPSYLLRNQARRFAGTRAARLAQWLAARVAARGVDATGSGHYLNLVWFDPSLPAAPPNDLPTLHHFADLGIVSARSGWEGPATHLVATCGPPLGHTHAACERDYGAGHVHPDCGHVTLVSGGDILLRDDGYAKPKKTGWHNTLLIDGAGQKGGGKTWFDFAAWRREPGAPRITAVEPGPETDVIVCDPTAAYPAAAGLARWTRRIAFHKPDRVVVTDRVSMKRPARLAWRYHCEGPLEQTGPARFRTASGRASAVIRVASGDAILAEKTTVATGRGKTAPHDCLSVRTRGPVSAAAVTTTIRIERQGE